MSRRGAMPRVGLGAVLAAAALAAPALAQSGPAPAPPAAGPAFAVAVQHGVLGCMFEIALYGVSETEARRLVAEATAELDRVEDALGGWRDDTALARLNREAADRKVQPPPLLLDALLRARELARATDGAFDVTVAPLVDAYGFRGSAGGRVPTPAELEALRACVGIDHLVIDAEAGSVTFDRPGVKVDLDGLNKGIAVDRVVLLLERAGVRDATISAGGSTIASIGPPPGAEPRPVAIAGPDGTVHERVLLRDQTLSTSGAWRRSLLIDGVEVGSIFDPRSGRPVANDVVSATAIASRGDVSEAYAKAALVLGPEAASALAARSGEVELVLLLRGKDEAEPIRTLRLGRPH